MALPPPYQLVDNEYTLLESTDLVFIDPVSTGYSRSVPKEKPEQFHSVKKDIESVGDFIRLWTTRNKRWGSPKFLIGESYGTTRAAGLAGYLQDRRGFYLNGIMLVSSILNFLTTEFDPGNDLPYILFLPSYCASAWFHNKLVSQQDNSLNKVLDEVQKFAYGEYCLALVKGSRLQKEERIQIARKLSRYTGLSEEYIERSNLRIEINRFCKELRRTEGITIGRFDSRFTGFDRDSAGEFPETDPSYAAVLGPYTAAMYDYLRRDLSFEIDQPYEILSSVHETWNYDTFQNKYVNTAEDLRKAFILNPHLKVIVCSGYYDLATPYLASQYTFEHLEIPDQLRNNIRMAYYEAGHMMYLHKASLVKLAGDLSRFIADSAG
jgi:carboxypeptidase C (cathepsin A)